MFSRNSERTASEDRRTSTVLPGIRDSSPASPTVPAIPPDVSVVGRGDHIEGSFKIADTLRVMGVLEGTIEATTVHIEDGATVHADVTADEVVIGGEYTGKLLCRQRLEVRASGRVSGQIETFRLMLHEGASLDGELHMLKQPGKPESAPVRGGPSIRGLAEVGIRAASPPGAPAMSAPLPPGAEPIG
jgi:cytoskeletal protein CcmA (bactofilin family)